MPALLSGALGLRFERGMGDFDGGGGALVCFLVVVTAVAAGATCVPNL